MLKPGESIGPYEIRGFVGQGGMGQVYRAFDPRLERTVALKVMLVPAGTENADSGRARSEISSRQLREARAVASLSHPNVVAIYDVGESNGRLYLAMEYVVGVPLRNLVRSEDVPLARRLRWLVDVARALDAAHKKGVVHRDVKPENVMIREDGGVKVLDFGIARRAPSVKPEDQHAVDTVTGGGAISGTPVYMAPEQIRGRDIDARCDQFAWGVMAYELVVGERPWHDGGDVLSLVAKILTDPPPPLRPRAPDISPVIEETIMRALAKDPDARFASIGEAADVLERFATQASGDGRVLVSPSHARHDPSAYAQTTRVPTTTSVPTPPPSGAANASEERSEARRRRVTQIGWALVLAFAVVVTGLYIRRKPQPIVTTTPSAQRPLSSVPAAESAYREGMSLWHDGATTKAQAALKRAIELDPTFAAAHLELALQSSGGFGSAQESFQSAFEHRHMLLARDSALLEASEPYVRPKPDLDEWETRLTSVVFQYPRDAELQFYLGRAHERQADIESARDAYEAATKLDESFVPALAALANVEKSLGHIDRGLELTDRCLKRSPVAVTCFETRYHLFAAAGQCHRAREEAAQWGTLEPQSPRPFEALAQALHADGAPRPAVEEVLSRKWGLLSESDRKQAELLDRINLSILDGDLVRAEELARELDAALPASADAHDHAKPAGLRVYFLIEMDRMKDAAKVAKTYLDRMPAWTLYPFTPDPSLDFYEPLVRTGEITPAELTTQRSAWIAKERQRLGAPRAQRVTWSTWAAVWGGFAETKDESVEALAQVPDEPFPAEGRTSLLLEFAMGKVLVLAGQPARAIPHLRRVLSACVSFERTMILQRARWYLAMASEAVGDTATARESYEKILSTWPKTMPSGTSKRAAEKLAALPR